MESSRRHRRFYSSPSIEMRYNPSSSDEDALSLHNLNDEMSIGMDFLTSNFQSLIEKHFYQSIHRYEDVHRTGWIINGSFFDEQIFQSSHSPSILKYSNTPNDLNRFLQGHHVQTISSSSLNAHLFKLAFILTLTDGSIEKEAIIDFYPQENEIFDDIRNYKHFCFPEFHVERSAEVLHESSTYIFTRTLSDGQIEYGYCRRIAKDHHSRSSNPTVICIVSTFSYFKLYDGILSELTSAYLLNVVECGLLIQSFYSKPIPMPTLTSSGIICILNDRRVFFHICPRDDRLNHDYFFTLLSCLSPQHIVDLFESILSSKRLLFYSNSLSKLTKSCLAFSFLICPFIWPYSFVSLMPSSWLNDLLDSPCPFIYGCLTENRKSLENKFDHDAIEIDLDQNTIENMSDEILPLPMNLRQTFETSLSYLTKFRLIKSDPILVNIAVSEAFLHVFIELFYLLPDYFQRSNVHDGHFSLCSTYFQSSEKENSSNRFDYSFRNEEFLNGQPFPSYKTFLKDFTKGMIFLKFLDDFQPNSSEWNLFSQRVKERREILVNHPSINPMLHFRQTFDLLHKQLKQSSKPTDPLMSKLKKKFFH